MDLTGEILEHAAAHFDSAGVAVDGSAAILVLGLESTKEQDLDRMTFEEGRMRYHGWTDHVKPKMMALMEVLRNKGFEAEPVGWWGYPRGEVLGLKRWAVMAGLGQQGKNTLILDPAVGHRIRLAAMWTDAPLAHTGPGVYEHREHPMCHSCNICIDACPVEGLLEPYRLLDPARCLVNIESPLVRDRHGTCREACRIDCPVGGE
jgi:ferredoxin